MSNKYWFKPKRYGYGAYPTSWEGWLVVVAFFLIVVWRAMLLETDPDRLIKELLVAAISLIIISKWKTDGKWKWRWGAKR